MAPQHLHRLQSECPGFGSHVDPRQVDPSKGIVSKKHPGYKGLNMVKHKQQSVGLKIEICDFVTICNNVHPVTGNFQVLFGTAVDVVIVIIVCTCWGGSQNSA